jgi:hypothetical protein
MTFDPTSAAGARTVVLTLQAADGAERPVRWELTRAGRQVAEGQLRPRQTRDVRIPVPSCPNGDSCAPVRWTLEASGPPVFSPLPAYGAAPGPLRPVVLMVVAAQISPGG